MSDGKLKERDYFIQKEPGPAKENGAPKPQVNRLKDSTVPGTAKGGK